MVPPEGWVTGITGSDWSEGYRLFNNPRKILFNNHGTVVDQCTGRTDEQAVLIAHAAATSVHIRDRRTCRRDDGSTAVTSASGG
jgi:hypothetical protein